MSQTGSRSRDAAQAESASLAPGARAHSVAWLGLDPNEIFVDMKCLHNSQFTSKWPRPRVRVQCLRYDRVARLARELRCAGIFTACWGLSRLQLHLDE